MGIHVVSAILRVVLKDEYSGVVPVRPVGNGIDYAAQSEIVIRDIRRRAGAVGSRTAGMVIRKVEQDERWQFEIGAFMRLARAYIGAELVEKFVGAKLIGIVGIEVGIERIKMIAQSGLRRLH